MKDARAAERGQHMGRPSALTPEQRREGLQALASGTATQADLARRFAVSQSTISRLSAQPAARMAAPALDPETDRAVRSFLRQTRDRYAVRESILFGSRARRSHRPDSDADLAVILKGKRGDRSAAARDMAEIAFDVMMETGVLVEPLPLWEAELKRPELFGNPALIETIARDGLRL